VVLKCHSGLLGDWPALAKQEILKKEYFRGLCLKKIATKGRFYEISQIIIRLSADGGVSRCGSVSIDKSRFAAFGTSTV
jgi:hypothetical protein